MEEDVCNDRSDYLRRVIGDTPHLWGHSGNLNVHLQNSPQIAWESASVTACEVIGIELEISFSGKLLTALSYNIILDKYIISSYHMNELN
jgi:hypothetical protein